MDFDMMGLAPGLVAGLARQGITDPSPIQKKAIPHAMNGRDVMGLAQTGTGKTAAFGLPLIHALSSAGTAPVPGTATALILAPTRELARQIMDNLEEYAAGTRLGMALVVGGAAINPQIGRLRRGCDVLVATPGRLIDLLDRKALRLDRTRYFVLDEADQMLDLGFIHALRRIAPLLPRARQTMLFSATMPKQMSELSAAYLSDPVRVEAAPPGRPADKVAQSLHFVEQADKTALLAGHLAGHAGEQALVFTRTKHGAERLMKALAREGFAAGSIHGNKSQGQRTRALQAFRDGTLKVLVATDVAARGLDISSIRHVYNFDLPNVPDNYVHRIGRTARAGREGFAIAYCAPAEMGELRAIQKLLGTDIPVGGGTCWEPRAAQARRAGPGGGGRRGRRRGGARRAA